MKSILEMIISPDSANSIRKKTKVIDILTLLHDLNNRNSVSEMTLTDEILTGNTITIM